MYVAFIIILSMLIQPYDCKGNNILCYLYRLLEYRKEWAENVTCSCRTV